MIKRIKLSDRILLVAVTSLFVVSTLGLIWLRLNFDQVVSMIQVVH